MAGGVWRGEIGDEALARRILRAAAGALVAVSLASLAYSAGMSLWALGALAARVELIDLPTVALFGVLAVWLLRTRSRIAAFGMFLAGGLLAMLHVLKAVQPLTALPRLAHTPQFLTAFAISDGLSLLVAGAWVAADYLAWRAIDATEVLRGQSSGEAGSPE